MPQAPIIEFRDEEDHNHLVAPISCQLTRTHGTWPNSLIIEVAPQANPIPLTGTIHIEFEGITLDIPDCVVDDTTIQADTRRQTNTVILYDRRWKWWFGEISGNYNRRDDSGNLIGRKDADVPALQNQEGVVIEFFKTVGEKSPQELAELLLEAMGEEDYDISQLPNDDDVRPEIDWDMANPAQELNNLCELLGCRVVLSWDNKVVLHKLNSGKELPIDPVVQIKGSYIGFPTVRVARAIDAKQRPDKIAVKTSPIVYQMDMRLEPVILDKDGVIKNIFDDDVSLGKASGRRKLWWRDRDSSFDPNTGFTLSNPPDQEFSDDEMDAQEDMANRTVFKWYRIRTPFTFEGTVTEEDATARLSFEVDTLDRILPILDYRSSTVIENGRVSNEPSVVYGMFQDDFGLNSNVNEDEVANNTEDTNVPEIVPLPFIGAKNSKMIVPIGYTVDVTKGIIKFSRPLYLVYGTTVTRTWNAHLYYRACFTWRMDTGDRHALLRVREQPEPHLGTKALYVRRPELVPVTALKYKATTFDNPEIWTNEEAINTIADKYIDELERQYETTAPAMAEYAGLYPMELDGTIRSVSYRIDAGGVYTTAHYQQDVGGFGNLGYAAMKRNDQITRIMNDLRGGKLPRQLVKEIRENPLVL